MNQKTPTLREYLESYKPNLKSQQSQKSHLSPPVSHSQLLTEKLFQIKKLLKQKLSQKDYKVMEASLEEVQDLFFLQLHQLENDGKSQINVRSSIGKTTIHKLRTNRRLATKKIQQRDNKQNLRSSKTSMNFQSIADIRKDQKFDVQNGTEFSFIDKWTQTKSRPKFNKNLNVNDFIPDVPQLQRKFSHDIEAQSLRGTNQTRKTENYAHTYTYTF